MTALVAAVYLRPSLNRKNPQENQVARHQIFIFETPALKADIDRPVFAVPWTRGNLGNYRKWMFAVRLWIIIIKIIYHFLNPNSALRQKLAVLYKSPDV